MSVGSVVHSPSVTGDCALTKGIDATITIVRLTMRTARGRADSRGNTQAQTDAFILDPFVRPWLRCLENPVPRRMENSFDNVEPEFLACSLQGWNRRHLALERDLEA